MMWFSVAWSEIVWLEFNDLQRQSWNSCSCWSSWHYWCNDTPIYTFRDFTRVRGGNLVLLKIFPSCLCLTTVVSTRARIQVYAYWTVSNESLVWRSSAIMSFLSLDDALSACMILSSHLLDSPEQLHPVPTLLAWSSTMLADRDWHSSPFYTA